MTSGEWNGYLSMSIAGAIRQLHEEDPALALRGLELALSDFTDAQRGGSTPELADMLLATRERRLARGRGVRATAAGNRYSSEWL